MYILYKIHKILHGIIRKRDKVNFIPLVYHFNMLNIGRSFTTNHSFKF